MRVKACVLTGFGINADEELALAFEMAGARACRVHARDLVDSPDRLQGFQILAFPGGFSFGDHLGSGKVFATLFRRSLGPALEKHVLRGGLVLGVCNGFQALVKMGFLPDLSGTRSQEVSLIHNDSGRFEDRWVRVRFQSACKCLWTRGLTGMDLSPGFVRLPAEPDRPGRRRSGGRLASTFLAVYLGVPGGPGTTIRGIA